MKTLRNFAGIIDRQTITIISLTFLLTWVCIQFKWSIIMPFDIVGVAIIFPIVFSINAAYTRREKALEYYAAIKTLCACMYYAHRDWRPEDGNLHAQRIKPILDNLHTAVRAYFTGGAGAAEALTEVYACFSAISGSNRILRDSGVAATEITVINRYLNDLMTHFERMKDIRNYRTPISLRAYSQVFLNSFPLLFAPYFAHLSISQSYPLGFMVGGLYGLIVVSLDNIQEDLENPFDQEGTDDLNLDGGTYQQTITDHHIPGEPV